MWAGEGLRAREEASLLRGHCFRQVMDTGVAGDYEAFGGLPLGAPVGGIRLVGAIPPWCFRTVKTDPGGLPRAREITLIDSPARQRLHRSSFI